MKRVERVRVYPTARQEFKLRYILDVTRELYNALLEQRREAYRRRGIAITTIEQYHEITELRREDSYFGTRLRAVYRECLDAALHRLDLSFTAFFRRRGSGEDVGYPRFKSARRWTQIEFCHGDRALFFDDSQKRLRIPGIGSVRVRRGRRVPPFKRAWIVCKNERWYASFECEREQKCGPLTSRQVGLDRGVRVLAATSDGETISNPRFAANNRTVIFHQRDVVRKTLWTSCGKVGNWHDKERRKAILRLRRARERERNARRDYLHKKARILVNAYSTIVLERLQIRLMTRSARGTTEIPGKGVRAKAGLNREILDASFSMFRSMIVAKAEEAGRRVIEVHPRYTSQTCAVCHYRSAKNRNGAFFACVSCGNCSDADVNAAKVILQKAQLALKSEPYAEEESARTARSPAKARTSKTRKRPKNKNADVIDVS